MKPLSWFRLYAEAVDDEKLRLLAFEDRWHFVALLCCKASGILDGDDLPLMMRKVAVKLGLDLRELGEVARRLAEVGLVDRETLQPIAWDHRQFQSDTSTERVKAYRERQKRYGNVSVTAQETETETETEKRKARKRSATPSAPPDVPADLWNDWLAVRKAKHQPLTMTALNGVRREAAKAKLSLADAIRISVEKGWAGFSFSWLQEAAARAAKAGAQDAADRPWHESATGTEAKGRELGLDPDTFRLPDGRQDWQGFRSAVLRKAGVGPQGVAA